MGNKPSCSFQSVCFCFSKELCFATNIDEKNCGGPTVMGQKIVDVANISGSNHKIAIISQCPDCNKIIGIVTGDQEPIPYKMDSVLLSQARRNKIPNAICQQCSGKDAGRVIIHTEPAPQTPMRIFA